MPQMSDMVASEKELRQRDPDVLIAGIRRILNALEQSSEPGDSDLRIRNICEKLLAGHALTEPAKM